MEGSGYPAMTRPLLQRFLYAISGVALCLFLAAAVQRPAHAYADPGTSLMLFQSLSAAVSGLLFYFRRRLRMLFSRPSAVQAQVQPSSDRP